MDLLLLLLLLQGGASSLVLAALRHPVPVLWMVSAGPGPDNISEVVAPAVLQALQDLRRQPPPLGSYEIQLQPLRLQCDPGQTLKALFEALWAGPRYALLLGGACPSVTPLIARALPAFHLVQVSYGSPSASLSNRKWYGSLFSTAPPDWALSRAAVKLLQVYGWTRVGLLAPPETSADLRRRLQKDKIQVLPSGGPAEDVCSGVRNLKELDVRIIVGSLEEASAAEVFCCAHRLDMFGARYQWILVGGAPGGRRSGSRASGCSANSLLTAADGSIWLRVRTAGGPEDSQGAALSQLIQDRSELSRHRAFAYDAVWVAAKALSQVMEAARSREKKKRREDGSPGREEVHQALLEALEHTQFTGRTGRLFYRNGERMATVELIQRQGTNGVLVGDFSTWTQNLTLRTQLLRFHGPGPARDRPLVLLRQLRVPLGAHLLLSSAAALTTVSTLTVLLLTVFSRGHRPLRAGAQEALLLLGLLLSSSSVLLSGLDPPSPSGWTSDLLCSGGLWTLWVGHSLTFAVVFTRTWVLSSARTPLPRAGGLVLWALLLDLAVLASWQTLDPLRWSVLQHGSQTDPADPDILIQLFSEQCRSANMQPWLTAVFGYKGPLLGLGCYLAWSVRAAGGGRGLALAMFTLAAFSASGAAVSLLTAHNPSLRFCLGGVLVLSCHVLTLCVLFPLQPLQNEAAEGGEEQRNRAEEEQLEEWQSRAAQLDAELQRLMMQLWEEPESAPRALRRSSGDGAHDCAPAGDVRWATCLNSQKPSSPEAINAPEHMRRRLSVQLPILHHSYLPAVGGVRASSSSLFGSGEAFVHYDLMTPSCVSATAAPESRHC